MRQRTVEKFHWLSEQYAKERIRDAIVSTVEHLDEKRVSEVTALLAHVSHDLGFPKPARLYRTFAIWPWPLSARKQPAG